MLERPQVGIYLFANDRTREMWLRTNGQGMLLNGCTYSHAAHRMTDVHGNTLHLVIASNSDRVRGIWVDKAETMDPVDSERMFIAWEMIKSRVRHRPPVLHCGQEGHDDGQGLDRQRDQTPGGASPAVGSASGSNDTQEQAEGGDRRGGRAAGAEAGGVGEDVGRVQVNCRCAPGSVSRYPDDGTCRYCGGNLRGLCRWYIA